VIHQINNYNISNINKACDQIRKYHNYVLMKINQLQSVHNLNNAEKGQLGWKIMK
jgi:hypothetical protein